MKTILNWILSFFVSSKTAPKKPGDPYRTAAVVEEDPTLPVPKKVRKNISYQPWRNAFKEFIPMYVRKLSALITCGLLSLIAMGAIYDIDSPSTRGLRLCIGLACGILTLFFGINAGNAMEKHADEVKQAAHEAKYGKDR